MCSKFWFGLGASVMLYERGGTKGGREGWGGVYRGANAAAGWEDIFSASGLL